MSTIVPHGLALKFNIFKLRILSLCRDTQTHTSHTHTYYYYIELGIQFAVMQSAARIYTAHTHTIYDSNAMAKNGLSLSLIIIIVLQHQFGLVELVWPDDLRWRWRWRTAPTHHIKSKRTVDVIRPIWNGRMVIESVYIFGLPTGMQALRLETAEFMRWSVCVRKSREYF